MLERVYNAAEKFDTDILVQITGDCPLIDPELVDNAIEMFLQIFPATRFVSNTGPNISMPWGFDVQVYKAGELKIILGSEDLSVEDHEHVSSRFYKRSLNHLYKPIFLKYPYPLNRSELRVTLDYHEDFELIKAIILSLGPSEIVNVPMYDIIKWLDKNPAIRDSSIERHRNG